jgi:glycosyltransferase involved in cell wall biosynthesis
MFNELSVSLVLPTYNEKDSIRASINAFDALGVVDEILVINNNAKPGTSEEVAGTAARELVETTQGYGAAIMRGFREARGDIIVLCEPDGTFSAEDIFKLLEYTRDFDVVYGSRTLNDLIWEGANMGWFLRFGNWSVAKLMEMLFGSCSLSDVGCTYRALHRRVLPTIFNNCRIQGSHFGPEMMITTIRAGLRNVQLPVNYKERVGISSVTGDLWVAFKLGMRMIWLILYKRLQAFPR